MLRILIFVFISFYGLNASAALLESFLSNVSTTLITQGYRDLQNLNPGPSNAQVINANQAPPEQRYAYQNHGHINVLRQPISLPIGSRYEPYDILFVNNTSYEIEIIGGLFNNAINPQALLSQQNRININPCDYARPVASQTFLYGLSRSFQAAGNNAVPFTTQAFSTATLFPPFNNGASAGCEQFRRAMVQESQNNEVLKYNGLIPRGPLYPGSNINSKILVYRSRKPSGYLAYRFRGNPRTFYHYF